MTARTAAVLTVSDGVAAGTRQDRSGTALAHRLEAAGFEVVAREVVPDDIGRISAALRELTRSARLVVTTGGTGLGPRDVTPEATRSLLDRETPGLAEAMRAAGRASTPMADLSRALTGSVGECLVINLPGSPTGAVESLEAVLAVVPHALDLLAGRTRHGHADQRPPDAPAPAGDEPRGDIVDEPRGEVRDEPRGEVRDEPRGEVRDEPRGEVRDEPRGEVRDEPRGEVRDEPRGDVLDELRRHLGRGEQLVLATALRTDGAPPCEPGQKLLLSRDAALAGTLGCAEFDDAALADAAEALATGRLTMRTYEHDRGTVEVSLEPFGHQPTLAVLGATQVARWLLRWGRDLGYATVLVESRSERVTADHRAAADRVVDSIADVQLDPTAVVAHTDHDAPQVADELASALEAEAGFVGLVSSRRHVTDHLRAIRAAGADPARLRTPLGLDLGGRTPQEIALSILAGVVADRHGRDGGWMDRRPDV
ncbi:MAG TPA: molybdenum cofactor synthesis domain-containing protein [Nitriliruptorales bacterium]|nr:molybdenum cofactor synthesis domain-containing protein [Nitriliruptorales bacterium]